ncbi:hypothetical protein CFE70_002429 [Pyrenophora teres f. teres 0-1]
MDQGPAPAYPTQPETACRACYPHLTKPHATRCAWWAAGGGLHGVCLRQLSSTLAELSAAWMGVQPARDRRSMLVYTFYRLVDVHLGLLTGRASASRFANVLTSGTVSVPPTHVRAHDHAHVHVHATASARLQRSIQRPRWANRRDNALCHGDPVDERFRFHLGPPSTLPGAEYKAISVNFTLASKSSTALQSRREHQFLFVCARPCPLAAVNTPFSTVPDAGVNSNTFTNAYREIKVLSYYLSEEFGAQR